MAEYDRNKDIQSRDTGVKDREKKKEKKEEKEAPASERLPQQDDDLKKIAEKLLKAIEKLEEAQKEEEEEIDEIEKIPLREKRIARLIDLQTNFNEINRRLNLLIAK